jgi:hypothetical protein
MAAPLRYCKHITFIWLFIKTCVSYFVHGTTRWLRSCGSHRPRSGSTRHGASGPPGHVREDPCCGHEVLCSRELRRGRRDSSPSAPPSVVVELRLDCGFAADVLFSTNGRNYCGFVIILSSNRTGRPPPIPTVGPQQQPLSPMYTLGGSRQPAF